MMPLLQDLLDLPKIAAPYFFQPLTAAEIFFPHARPVAWFTNSAFFDPGRNIRNLNGKVILVTGGNAGLGQETVFRLVQHEPKKIYMASRTADRARNAISDILQKLESDGCSNIPDIEFLNLDLTDLDSVNSAAQQVLAENDRLDILVLNAGIMATPSSKTKSGHDLQLGTNHLGHFLLVKLLMPLLRRTVEKEPIPDVRIVTVSSEAHNIAPSDSLDLIENHEKLCSSSNYTRYGVSKAANILFAAEVARRYGGEGIISVSLHPGVILTDLYTATKDANIFVRYGLPLVARFVFDDVKNGALTQLWCAAGAKVDELENGAYYTPVGRLRNNRWVEDKESAERLFDWSYEQVKDFLVQEKEQEQTRESMSRA